MSKNEEGNLVMTEAIKRKYSRMAVIGFVLATILLILVLSEFPNLDGTNLPLVYLWDATFISGLFALTFGLLGLLSYIVVSYSKRKQSLGVIDVTIFSVTIFSLIVLYVYLSG